MRKTLISLLLTGAAAVSAEDMQIRITPEQIDNLAIKVAPVAASQQVPLLSAPATVVVPASHELLLSTPQPGLLTKLQANIGDKVEKGQVLAQVHSSELVALQQQFLTAQSDLNLVGLEQQRDKKLLGEGVIAERRWQETQAMHSSKAALAGESRQLLIMAGMTESEINGLAKTHKLSSMLQVRSPMSGVILERLATLGTRLDMQAPLYRIADLSELWLEISIPQERVQSLRIGDLVSIANTGISAKISMLGQSIDRDTQTLLARAVIQGQADRLKVGQHVNVQVLQDDRQAAFKVPNTAIAQNTGHSYVFVRNANGFAVTEVAVVGKQNQDTVINGPLASGAEIAVQGAVALKANWLGLGGDE
ncbi:efflux RND transporter periplasmic adaptor subunit [Methylomonas sp. LL1]|uniref:efflux RND transporter periplasmic adaptor subunit n=1 Tax=Methylomonas sp. LL1 TaxID=2785785 RepID=UPI0018C41B81|nr:efflux RND transporter periplasmic adaptor subunit [Methylomonas sp. LL1]QPK62250.1 efflux RND transporter periplasmic adaptor subunit [Methylomonas sp. LL1]